MYNHIEVPDLLVGPDVDVEFELEPIIDVVFELDILDTTPRRCEVAYYEREYLVEKWLRIG